MALEEWPTVEAIAAAKARLRDRMPGWVTPAAYGVTLVEESAEVRFPVVNVPVHELPSLILGLVTGRRSESGSFPLSPSELDAAIALLAPAEAATMYHHPNLASWRDLAARWETMPGCRAVAVFLTTLDAGGDDESGDGAGDRYERALRDQIASGDRNLDVFVTD